MTGLKCKAGLSDASLEYYDGYNLSKVVEILLEMFDITVMPSVMRDITHRKCLTVYNVRFINLYHSYGARSEKVSITRLLEYGYDEDVLRLPQFKRPDLRYDKVVEDEKIAYVEILKKCKMLLYDAISIKPNDNIQNTITMIEKEIYDSEREETNLEVCGSDALCIVGGDGEPIRETDCREI